MWARNKFRRSVCAEQFFFPVSQFVLKRGQFVVQIFHSLAGLIRIQVIITKTDSKRIIPTLVIFPDELFCFFIRIKNRIFNPSNRRIQAGCSFLIIFMRDKHRPSHYFAEGDANILLSPASVDMGGVFITPLEKDFAKISEKNLVEITDEVEIDDDLFCAIENAIKPQPEVNVGIVYGEQKIDFEFNSPYKVSALLENEPLTVAGVQSVTLENGKILWNGCEYDQLLFTPDGLGTFWLRNVTIGVNFHWERKEDQKFEGKLKFIVENGALTAINVIGVEDYLTSVISSEMSATASENLLKAHAVISRSWLLAQIEKNKEIMADKKEYTACTQTEDDL